MIAIRGVAEAALKRIADYTAAPPALVWIFDHQVVAMFPDMRVELEVGHARLDERIAVASVDFEDAVHPCSQVQYDGAAGARRAAAVAEVLARRDRVQRDQVAVGDLDDLPHLLGRVGEDDSARGELVVVRHGEGILVGPDPLGRVGHPFVPDDAAELGQGRVEVLGADIGRQRPIVPCSVDASLLRHDFEDPGCPMELRLLRRGNGRFAKWIGVLSPTAETRRHCGFNEVERDVTTESQWT